MNTPPAYFTRYLNTLGAQLGTPLLLRDGVCALYDSLENEVAVIELPEHSEMLVFHATMGPRPQSPAMLQRLLSLNFEIARLRGCWFALDQDEVRLCTQRELAGLSEAQFCDVALGFIGQAHEARQWVNG